MKEIKEKQIQRAILDYLRANKIYCWKNHNVGIFKQATGSYIPSGHPGISDILGILPDGKFLAIEVKKKGGKLTFFQETFLKDINERNGIGILAYSVDDVEKILKERGYIKDD